jgi:hypothetical protein
MKWFQGALSQQIRAENHHDGPTLEGRYKAAPIDHRQDNGVLLVECADYLHLLPEKEDLLEPWEPLDASSRTSLPYYSGRGTDCPSWLDPGPVFAAAELPLSFTGRAKYIRQLEHRVRTWSTEPGRLEEKTRVSRFLRGWYVGGRDFGSFLREKLQTRVAQGDHTAGGRSADAVSRVSEEDRARELLQNRLAELGLPLEALRQRAKSDPLKIALAAELRDNAMVSNRWLSDTLQMGHPSRVSRYTRGELSPALAGKVRRIRQDLGD